MRVFLLLQEVYTVPKIDGPVFLATFQDDVFATGQFVKSSASKYTGQAWTYKTQEEDGAIPGDKVCCDLVEVLFEKTSKVMAAGGLLGGLP